MQKTVLSVVKGSIAEELGVEAGDALLAVNGAPVKDIFDYRYLIQDEYIEVLFQNQNGEQWIAEIEKEISEDLGLEFEDGLMDEARSCKNKCIFCFIDQLPRGMRDTLYFKDDDSRLSFISGNYVTLTNMDDDDLDRIIYYHLSPINISVHATDLDVRKYMLKNPRSIKLFDQLQKIKDSHIDMNFQVVLVKGVNDKEVLDKTIADLTVFLPQAKSMSVVPVGITRYRDGLFPLAAFTKEDKKQVVEQIETWQRHCLAQYGSRFVYAADEFYLDAGLSLPDVSCYEGFPQMENGVGMMAAFIDGFEKYYACAPKAPAPFRVSTVTGSLAAGSIQKLARRLESKNIDVAVHVVKNRFFGEHITVTGLITAQDILSQLADKDLGKALLIPKNMIKQDAPVFLDDISLDQLQEKLQVPVVLVETSGEDFIKKALHPLSHQNEWRKK